MARSSTPGFSKSISSTAIPVRRRTLSKRPDPDYDLFNSTSHRWLYNESLRLAERQRIFNLPGLRQLAAHSVGRQPSDILSLSKLGEGGFNRTFLITMRDGFRMVARVPYGFPPVYLTVASEVATMDLLHSKGIPVPKIYGYNPSPDNEARTEYMFMEYVQGTSLADVWQDTVQNDPDESRAILKQVLDRDLEGLVTRTPIPLEDDRFCVGPDVSHMSWFGRRSQLDVDRGPFARAQDMLVAPALKELAYLKQFGYGYKEKFPAEHTANLRRYLEMVPSLIRNTGTDLGRFCLRHPDLRDGNVFVERRSDSTDSSSVAGNGKWRIVSIIDWERTSALPEFLHDSVFQQLCVYDPQPDPDERPWHPNIAPSLPGNFSEITDEGQRAKVEETYRRQFINHLYVQSGGPWMGETLELKVGLMKAEENWDILNGVARGSSVPAPSCPITFDPQDVAETMALMKTQARVDWPLRIFEGITRISEAGREARKFCREELEEKLERAETEEDRERVKEHWMYNDRDEEVYT
ncbi:hypothetical protein FA13DRAFT_1749237 [Coprinellus micaceus]|uniref:Aminoglycoside phosphotransferase domain-containing protein n=1 Tax=Coprinellus micaceus TaxID=71717 RepID=A0A4Y7RLI6_COPMI|nr:hypothetical protein FA13DRAFT_1749237 [Coprinellus micaceus]